MTAGEAAAWISFYLLQSIGIAFLIYGTNHGKVPISDLVWVGLFKLLLNILLYLPLWWLFFYKLRHLSLKAKAWLHLIVGPVFAALWTGSYGGFLITTGFDPHYSIYLVCGMAIRQSFTTSWCLPCFMPITSGKKRNKS